MERKLHGSALLFLRSWLYVHQSSCFKLCLGSSSKWHTDCSPYFQQVALPPTLLRRSKGSDTGSLFSSFTPACCCNIIAHIPFLPWQSHDLSSEPLTHSSNFPDGNSDLTCPDWSSFPPNQKLLLVFLCLLRTRPFLQSPSVSCLSLRFNQWSNPVYSTSAMSFASLFSFSFLFLDYCTAYWKFSLLLALPSPAPTINPS